MDDRTQPQGQRRAFPKAHRALDEIGDLPQERCPNCGALSLMPIDDMWHEIERRVLEDAEMWACACGYSENRAAPDELRP